MRRLVMVTLMALALLGGARGAAVAGEEWCENDPLVVIATPGGALVPLYVTNGAAGVEHLAAVQLADIRYTTASTDSATATLVRMTVTVPSAPDGTRFETRSVVSTGPLKTGTILASAKGFSDQPMRLEFKLGTP